MRNIQHSLLWALRCVVFTSLCWDDSPLAGEVFPSAVRWIGCRGCAWLVPGLCSCALVSLTLLYSTSIYLLHYIKFYTVSFQSHWRQGRDGSLRDPLPSFRSRWMRCVQTRLEQQTAREMALEMALTACHDLPRPCPFTTYSLLLYIYRVVHLQLIQFTVTVHDFYIIYYRQKAVCYTTIYRRYIYIIIIHTRLMSYPIFQSSDMNK